MQQKLTLIIQSKYSFLLFVGQHWSGTDVAGFGDVYLASDINVLVEFYFGRYFSLVLKAGQDFKE